MGRLGTKWGAGPGEDTAREELMTKFAPVIRFIAQRLAFRLPPSLDIQDLLQAGTMGLMDAMGKFDPGRQTQFKTYAEFRIRGAMLDEIRSLDWVPRSVRDKIGRLRKTYRGLEQQLGRRPTSEEIGAALEMRPDEFETFIYEARTVAVLSLGDLEIKEAIPRLLLEALADPRCEDPLLSLLSRDIRGKLTGEIGRLPEKERLVVSFYYQKEMTMKEIGRALGLTESRVCQLHSQAILRLKGKLGKAHPEILGDQS